MNIIRSLVCLFILAIAVSCEQKTATVNQDALIDSLLTEFSDAWNSGDAEKIADYYSGDAIFITYADTRSGRDSILTLCKAVAGNIKNMKASGGTFSIEEDLITGTFLYTFDWVGEDQKLHANRGSSTVYWKKDEANHWRPNLHLYNHAEVINN